MKYRNGYSSHWERQFTCPRSLSYWRKWALHEERYILHVSYLKKKKNSLSRHWSTADYEARTIPVTLPYMVWRVWLTEILETFQRVFRFEKSRIKENGGNGLHRCKILKILCVRCNFVKFDIHFLWLPLELFFGVTTDDLLHLFKPLKNVRKNAMCFKLFW